MCAVVFAWLSALSVYDIRRRRLPNWLTLPGAVAVLVFAFGAGRGLPALFGGLALFGLYLIIHLAAPAAMGAGDVKLAIGLGALTGYFGIAVWSLAALAAPLLTAGWMLISLVCHCSRAAAIAPGSSRSRRPSLAFPHGSSMCAASGAAVALALI